MRDSMLIDGLTDVFSGDHMGDHGGERRRAVGHHARPDGRVRARVADQGGCGGRRRPVRRGDRPGPGHRQAADRRRHRRRVPPLDHGRGARQAAARLQAGRHRHGRLGIRDQRRRGRPRARQRRGGRGAGPDADGQARGLGAGRGRPVDHGRRSDRGDPARAGEGAADDRRHGPDRGERGVRGSVAGRRRGPRLGLVAGERQRRCDRPGSPDRGVRGADRGHVCCTRWPAGSPSGASRRCASAEGWGSPRSTRRAEDPSRAVAPYCLLFSLHGRSGRPGPASSAPHGPSRGRIRCRHRPS